MGTNNGLVIHNNYSSLQFLEINCFENFHLCPTSDISTTLFPLSRIIIQHWCQQTTFLFLFISFYAKPTISAAFLLLVYWSRCSWSLAIDTLLWCQTMLGGFQRCVKVAGMLWLSVVVQGYLLSFTDSYNILRSKLLVSRAMPTFILLFFFLSMNNTKVSSKSPLPHYIAVYNVN